MFIEILLFSIILRISEAIPCNEITIDKNDFLYTNSKSSLLLNTD